MTRHTHQSALASPQAQWCRYPNESTVSKTHTVFCDWFVLVVVTITGDLVPGVNTGTDTVPFLVSPRESQGALTSPVHGRGNRNAQALPHHLTLDLRRLITCGDLVNHR